MGSTQERLLAELVLYQKAQAIASVRPIAQEVINTKKRASVYGALDGSKSQSDIVKITGNSVGGTSEAVSAFVKAGLAAPKSEYFEFAKALFTLDELGIDPSKLRGT